MWAVIVEALWQLVRAWNRGRGEAADPTSRFFLARTITLREELVLHLCDAITPDGVLVLVGLGVLLLCICLGRLSSFSIHLVVVCIRRRTQQAFPPLADRQAPAIRDAEAAREVQIEPEIIESDEEEPLPRPPAGLPPPPPQDALEDQRRRIAALHPPTARQAILNAPAPTRRSSRRRSHRRRSS